MQFIVVFFFNFIFDTSFWRYELLSSGYLICIDVWRADEIHAILQKFIYKMKNKAYFVVINIFCFFETQRGITAAVFSQQSLMESH